MILFCRCNLHPEQQITIWMKADDLLYCSKPTLPSLYHCQFDLLFIIPLFPLHRNREDLTKMTPFCSCMSLPVAGTLRIMA